jgi:hypothetical protein
MVLVLIFLVLASMPFVLVSWAAASWLRREDREAARRWRERLAGPSEALEELILGCEIFAMDTPQGKLRDDPEVARFLSRVRNREHVALAQELGDHFGMEALLAGAEWRMGCRHRPAAMDYGYLYEVLDELARRARATGGPPYR